MGFFLNDYCIANGINLRKRVSDLFDELEKNPELAAAFIRNPIVILQTKVFQEFPKFNVEQTNEANQFLFSVLSNDKFMRWLEKYRKKTIMQYNDSGKLPSKQKFLQEFAKGLIENGDPKILTDLLDTSPKTIERLNSSKFIEMDFIVSNKNFAIWELLFLIRISIFVYNYDYFTYQAAGIGKIDILDEQNKIVTISSKELRSLSDQIVKYAKQKREATEEKNLE
jgi:hypothetical protein